MSMDNSGSKSYIKEGAPALQNNAFACDFGQGAYVMNACRATYHPMKPHPTCNNHLRISGVFLIGANGYTPSTSAICQNQTDYYSDSCRSYGCESSYERMQPPNAAFLLEFRHLSSTTIDVCFFPNDAFTFVAFVVFCFLVFDVFTL
uniref:Uncharacterized protein n=1 Tax=Panagrellus redivivus TaxID=6233 RepID=A0A7E4VYU4_PANRE